MPNTAAPLSSLPAWARLLEHRRALEGVAVCDLFAADPDRFARFSWSAGDLLLDASRHRLTASALAALHDLAREAGVETQRARLFAGAEVNTTEHRAALHTALRAETGGTEVALAQATRERMLAFVDEVLAGERRGFRGDRFRAVVHLGIGGSDLGPALAVEALRPYHLGRLEIRFAANVDGHALNQALAGLDPATVLFTVASKSFTTAETLTNAHTARAWLARAAGGDRPALDAHFAAATAAPAAARAFGVPEDQCFPLWDWVGGRFSLWSAVGLPIALALGRTGFSGLLAGARQLDDHFREAPIEANLPVTLALLTLWYTAFWGAETHAVVPYDQRLARFPSYLQQLEMESNGKGVTCDGRPVTLPTAPVVWGDVGTNAQHAFFQLLHQGNRLVPVDFLVAAQPGHDLPERHHQLLLAHCLAQGEALLRGQDATETRQRLAAEGLSGAALEELLPHRVFPGNRPSSTLLFTRLDPATLGALLALYEHKVFTLGVLWRVNPFDQWGVELGKALAQRLLPAVAGGPAPADLDGSTRGLLAALRARQPGP